MTACDPVWEPCEDGWDDDGPNAGRRYPMVRCACGEEVPDNERGREDHERAVDHYACDACGEVTTDPIKVLTDTAVTYHYDTDDCRDNHEDERNAAS